jgi:acyl carrier protein
MTATTNGRDDALRDQVKALIVQCARLKVPPSSIGNDQPLFDPQKGLGLDSIDVLELVVNLERSYGVTIQDRETGQRVLQSVNTIVDFIKASGASPAKG